MGIIMKARLVFACAAAGIAASLFSGPMAGAEEFSGSIRLNPDTVEPGYGLDISGTCNDPSFTTAPLTSQVLEPVSISGKDDGKGGRALSAHAKVKSDAAPGVWPVSFKCGTATVTGNLRVVAEPEPVRPALSIAPQKGVAGTKVTIDVICTDLAPVSSAALTIGKATVLQGGGEARPYFAVAGVVKNVKPGIYTVSSKCDGKPISTSFTVLASKQSPPKAQVPVKPTGAPETGGDPDAMSWGA
jgi:hypothetical protein